MIKDPLEGGEDALTHALIGEQDFGALAEAHRHELLVHCYRLLGSPLDAEDAVQEALLRAYRSLHTYVRDDSFRAWLYKIATNVCLDAIDRRRRTLPTLAYPPAGPESPPPDPIADPVWIEPFPSRSATISGGSPNPDARVESNETISLAFVAALQTLPPRQRAVLILRDVLEYRAREVARILDTTTSAVNSALHRARASLSARDMERGSQALGGSYADPALMERYLHAWESADVDRLVSLLLEEATLSMPPWPVWYQGRGPIGSILAEQVFGVPPSARDRLIKIRANEQPAFAIYRQGSPADDFFPMGIQVLTIAAGQDLIKAVDIFLLPDLFPVFQLPATLR